MGESAENILFHFHIRWSRRSESPESKKWHGFVEMCNTRVKNNAVAVCFIVVNSLTAPLVAAAELILLDMLAEEVQTI